MRLYRMAGVLPLPAGLPKSVGPPTIFATNQQKARWLKQGMPANWEDIMRFVKLALAGVCALGLIGAATASRAEPVKIRMSWVAPVSNWASIVLEKKDLMQHLGKSYTFEPIRYQGTPQTIAALANNELEIADFAYSTFAIAIANAGLSDLRVIGDEFQDSNPDYHIDGYWVRKDSGINKVEDMKGKIVGTNGGGSAIDVAQRAMLKKHGLVANHDYTLLEGP
jgi:sulfonate transport system substrate-binding protein